MLNLRPNRRPKMPNSLAFFAVLLLLISAAAGIHTSLDANFSEQEAGISIQADTSGNTDIDDAASTKPRGLNLGLLLFRRG